MKKKFKYTYIFPNRATHCIQAWTLDEADRWMQARARLLWIDPPPRDRKDRILKPQGSKSKSNE